MTKRRIFRALLLVGVLLLVGLILVAGLAVYFAPRIRAEVMDAISRKSGRPVELSSLGWSVWPRLGLQGRGLVIGSRDPESAPLAQVGEFSVEMTPGGLMASPRRIETLRLADLEVTISRGGKPRSEPAAAQAASRAKAPPIVIGQIVAERARIEITSTRPDKPPKVFELQRLLLDSFDLEQSVDYRAQMRYPKPAGDLEVEGSFGPVDFSEPRQTPYSGRYHFKDADLGVFGSIQGLLQTQGTFQGSVEQTSVRGEAEIPDFHLTKVGNIVPLNTSYEAEVRESGAVIRLVRVETAFRQSLLLTSGDISSLPDVDGRLVDLQVSGEKARVEDMVAFAVQAEEPPLVGDIELQTQVRILPGRTPFIERLRAEGSFHIREGRFSNLDIQKTLEKISSMGSGESGPEEGSGVFSDMRGLYLLENARIHFSELHFEVPGMKLDLTGDYVIESQELDFSGDARLQRKPSEMAPESLSRWIRIIDPILRGKEAGTVLPVRITGTRSQPRFRVDYRRLGRGR